MHEELAIQGSESFQKLKVEEVLRILKTDLERGLSAEEGEEVRALRV